MTLGLSIIAIILGFALVTFSADWLVDGASAIAKRLNVSDLVIGLTVVAFGTSAPELIVNIVAAGKGSTEIAITNILGSNAINIFVVLGMSALFCPLAVQKSTMKFELPLSVLAPLAVILFGLDFFLPTRAGEAGIHWIEGLILLLFFAAFMCHCFSQVKAEGNTSDEVKTMKLWKAIVLVLVGLAGLIASGEIIVDSAVFIARSLGVSDAVIGVTIVAFGTSLPELATSVVAAAKKRVDLAIGNVVGSNIFNVFCILGVSALIHPLDSYSNLLADALVAALGSLMVFLFLLGKKHRVGHWQGLLLLLVYAAYLYWLLR